MYIVNKLHYHRVSKTLDIHFDDKQIFTLSCEYLRTHSPSAEIQGHGNQSKDPLNLVLNKQDVAITKLEPIGHYAVRLAFDDGHDSGLYSWQYLRALSEEQIERWQRYQVRVEDYHANKDSIPIKFIP
jgi:DUF971 family protein